MSNPSNTVRQCDRRDVHGPHDYQAEFGAYFDVHCPGNDGVRKARTTVILTVEGPANRIDNVEDYIEEDLHARGFRVVEA